MLIALLAVGALEEELVLNDDYEDEVVTKGIYSKVVDRDSVPCNLI